MPVDNFFGCYLFLWYNNFDITKIKSNSYGGLATLIGQFNLATPSWDLFIILFFVLAAFIYGLSLGRDRIIIILVSIYVGLAIVNSAPYVKDLAGQVKLDIFAFKATAFLGLFILLFFMFSRSALLRTLGSGNVSGSWLQVIIFSFLHVGLLTSITLSFLPAESLDFLMPITRTVFVSEPARFIWMVAPIVVMFLVSDKD